MSLRGYRAVFRPRGSTLAYQPRRSGQTAVAPDLSRWYAVQECSSCRASHLTTCPPSQLGIGLSWSVTDDSLTADRCDRRDLNLVRVACSRRREDRGRGTDGVDAPADICQEYTHTSPPS